MRRIIRGAVRRKKFTESVEVNLCDKYYELGYEMAKSHHWICVDEDDIEWVIDEYRKRKRTGMGELDVIAYEVVEGWFETGQWEIDVYRKIKRDVERIAGEMDLDDRDMEEMIDKLVQCWTDGWVDYLLEKVQERLKIRKWDYTEI